MSIPKPPSNSETINTLGTVKPSAELEPDEYSFILDTTLKAQHREDSSVLTFIDSFIRNKNISQASAESGLHPSVGYRYRHQKDIALAIQKLIDRSSVKYGFDASELIERTKEMVDFDPIQMQNRDGSFKSNMYDIAPEARRNLKKLKVKNLFSEVEDINGIKSKIIIGEIIEYEFYDKLKAIDLVGKEKDLFKNTTKIEHTVSENMAAILLDSARRGQKASLDFNNVIEVKGSVVENDNNT